MANAYVMRTNMSVAIVAMVNHTHIEKGVVEILDDECPDYNTSSSVSVNNSHVVFPFLLILCHRASNGVPCDNDHVNTATIHSKKL